MTYAVFQLKRQHWWPDGYILNTITWTQLLDMIPKTCSPICASGWFASASGKSLYFNEHVLGYFHPMHIILITKVKWPSQYFSWLWQEESKPSLRASLSWYMAYLILCFVISSIQSQLCSSWAFLDIVSARCISAPPCKQCFCFQN